MNIKQNRCEECGKPKLNNFPLCTDCFRTASRKRHRGASASGDGSDQHQGPLFSSHYGRMLTEQDIDQLRQMRKQGVLTGRNDAELAQENDARMNAIADAVPVPNEIDNDKGENDEAFHLARWKEMLVLLGDDPKHRAILRLNAASSRHKAIRDWAAQL